MTGTNCDLFTHKSSRSYLNHLVHSTPSSASSYCSLCFCNTFYCTHQTKVTTSCSCKEHRLLLLNVVLPVSFQFPVTFFIHRLNKKVDNGAQNTLPCLDKTVTGFCFEPREKKDPNSRSLSVCYVLYKHCHCTYCHDGLIYLTRVSVCCVVVV